MNLENGYPSLDDCLSRQFATYYTSDRVGKLFQELYTDGTEIHDAFGNMWEYMAGHFAKSKARDYILGYELINEPWFGDTVGNPWLYVELGKTDKEFLQPLYQKVAPRIRKLDPTIPIFFEPSTPNFRVGFTELPLGDNDPNQVFSYHIYCTQGTSFVQKAICKIADGMYKHNFGGYVKNNNLTGFVTEFGAVPNNTQNLNQIDEQMNWMEANFQSWAYWQYKYFDDITTASAEESIWTSEGDLEENKLDMLTRTYAYAISGTPISTAYDSSTAKFSLTYAAAKQEVRPTEIFVSEDNHYPNGVKVTTTPDCAIYSTGQKNRVFVQSTCEENETITVQISQ